jgi:hypothetical protein
MHGRPFAKVVASRGLLGVHSRYGLHTRAVTVYRDPLIRRLQPLRFLHSCSGCFRLERLPGGTCTHWKAPPFHGARQFRTLAPGAETNVCQGVRGGMPPHTRRKSGQRRRQDQLFVVGLAQLIVAPYAGLYTDYRFSRTASVGG